MTYLWYGLVALGTLVSTWYVSVTVYNPDGWINYPELLRKDSGHAICWVFIVVGWTASFAAFGWWAVLWPVVLVVLATNFGWMFRNL